MIFESKVDWWYYATMLVALAIVVGAGFAVSKAGGRFAVLHAVVPGIFVVGIPLWLLFATRYEVTAEKLLVKAAWINIEIARADIRSITPARQGRSRSSPALSLDRLEIRYGNGETVLVSPKDKQGFLAALGFEQLPGL